MTRLPNDQGKENFERQLNPDIEAWIKALQKADDTFYNLMSLELWAITQTMDEIHPGFWGQYMQIRQDVMQQYIQQRRKQQNGDQDLVVSNHAHPLSYSPLRQNSEPAKSSAIRAHISAVSEFIESEWQESFPSTQSSLPALSTPDLLTEENLDLPTNHQLEPTAMNYLANMPYRAKQLGVSVDDAIAEVPATQEISLVPLPHLIRLPIIKDINPHLPLPTKGLKSMAISCWLTNQFFLAWPDRGKMSWVLKRLDAITLTPGQTIICQLGFQISGISQLPRVQLVKKLQSHPGLTATMVELNDGIPVPILALKDREIAIQLFHRGDKPYNLQAGQAFCWLLFGYRQENQIGQEQPSLAENSPVHQQTPVGQ